MRFMFETGFSGVEGRPVGRGTLPRRYVSKDGGMVFGPLKAGSALAISFLGWFFREFGARNCGA